MRANKTSGVLAAGAVALAAGGLAPLAHADLDFSISLNFSWCEPEIIAHDACDDVYAAPIVSSWRYTRDCEDYGYYRRWYGSAWSYGTHCGPFYGRRVYAFTDDCGVITWRPVYTPVYAPIYRSVWVDDVWCAPRSGVSVWYSSGNFSIGFGSRHSWGRRWRDCDDWGWNGWRTRDVCRPVVCAPVIYRPVIVANPVIVRPVVVQPIVYQPPVIAQQAPVLVPSSPVVQQPAVQPGAFVPDPALTSAGQMGPVAIDGADNQGRAKPRRFAQAGDGSNLPTPALPSGVREIKPDEVLVSKPGKPVALPSAKPLAPEAKPIARTDKPARGQAREFGTVRKPGDTRVVTKPVETTIEELKRPAGTPAAQPLAPAAKPARTFGRERTPVAPSAPIAPAAKQPADQPASKPIVVPSNSPSRTDKPARRVESRPFGGGAPSVQPTPRKPSAAPAQQPSGPVFAPSAPANKPSVSPSTGGNGGGFAPAKPARTFGRERTVAPAAPAFKPAAPAPAPVGPVAPAPAGDKKK
jgi:hypothetical protein